MKSKALILGYVWPEPQSSAAGLRTLNLIDTLLNSDWTVTFASPSKENLFSEKLKAKGITVRSVQANDSEFDSWIRDLQPDTVFFDRFVMEEQFGWRVREQVPTAIRILDTQDLHFLRRLREKALKRGCTHQKILYDLNTDRAEFESEDTFREIASIYRCDGSIVVSDFESALLIEKFQIPPGLVCLNRFHYPSPPISPSYLEREGLCMIGNFRHPPNVDGLHWFLKEIWPRIREILPWAKVHIYGAYPPREIMCLTDEKFGIRVEGPARDQFKALSKHRVNLAPLRFGAGIKGKITDGWWSGTPVVTTLVGSEGMSGGLPWGGFVADDPAEFSKKAVELYRDPESWATAQANGFRLMETLYSQSINSKDLINYLLSLRNESDHRTSFLRRLINFHSFKGMRYFSKWIEEKNRNLGGKTLL